MIISFIGHAIVAERTKVEARLKEAIKASIIDQDSVSCYVGQHGDFDEICASVCSLLKKEFPSIKIIYVMPYLSLHEQAKVREMQRLKLCDSSIYPPIEKAPPRFAISKRNDWMVKSASLVIAYVNHRHGGAYRALKTAQSNKKKIVNLGRLV